MTWWLIRFLGLVLALATSYLLIAIGVDPPWLRYMGAFSCGIATGTFVVMMVRRVCRI